MPICLPICLLSKTQGNGAPRARLCLSAAGCRPHHLEPPGQVGPAGPDAGGHNNRVVPPLASKSALLSFVPTSSSLAHPRCGGLRPWRALAPPRTAYVLPSLVPLASGPPLIRIGVSLPSSPGAQACHHPDRQGESAQPQQVCVGRSSGVQCCETSLAK